VLALFEVALFRIYGQSPVRLPCVGKRKAFGPKNLLLRNFKIGDLSRVLIARVSKPC
jgi:hypothetical protein